LREKINALRAKRKAPPLNPDGSDPLESESGRANKRRKVEEKVAKIKRENTQQKISKPEKPVKDETKSEKVETVVSNGASSSSSLAIPSVLEFATFDFSSGKPVPSYLQTNKRKPNKYALLKKAKEQKEKVETLKGTDKGQKLLQQQSWDKVIKKASGEKVKDDIEKLKKSIKRDQSKKKKSQKHWKQRLDAQTKRQEAAQKKRESNIGFAKQKRRDRKLGKKTTRRPGFEGRKTQMINKRKNSNNSNSTDNSNSKNKSE